MLNEPLNPGMGLARTAMVKGRVSPEALAELDAALAGRRRAPWLLRSEFAPLARADHNALDRWWDRAVIVGFKETMHAAFAVDELVERYGRRVAYIERSAPATIASILARPTFWAWGWPGQYEVFLDSIYAPAADGTGLEELWPLVAEARTYVERVALCWAAAHIAVFTSLAKARLPLFDYDALDWPGLCHHLGVVWDPSVANIDQRSRTTYGSPIELTKGELDAIGYFTQHVDSYKRLAIAASAPTAEPSRIDPTML